MTHDLVATLRPLLTAEASAEAHASGTEPGDLEQAVWLRLLEHLDAAGPPARPASAGCAAPSAPRPAAPAVPSRLERPYDDRARRRRRPRPRAAAPSPRPAAAPCTTRCADCPAAAPRLHGGPAVPEGPHIPGNRGGVGYLTGQSRPGTFQMPGMSAAIAHAGGCGPRSTGIGVMDNRRSGEREACAHGHERDHLGGDRAGRRADLQAAVPVLPERGGAVRQLPHRPARPEPRLGPEEVARGLRLRGPARRGGRRLGARHGRPRTARPPSASSASTPASRATASAPGCSRAAESALAGERGAKRFRLHTGHRSEGNLRLYRRVGYETVGTSQGDGRRTDDRPGEAGARRTSATCVTAVGSRRSLRPSAASRARTAAAARG